MKLSGPANVIPDVFSDTWILIFPHPAIFLPNSRYMSLSWEATPEIWNIERRNRRDNIETSRWSTGVSIKGSRQSVYILKVFQLESKFIRLCQKDSSQSISWKAHRRIKHNQGSCQILTVILRGTLCKSRNLSASCFKSHKPWK